ncbi:MAG: DUF202 domain-containing protein [Bacteroidales bacterium]
MFKRVSFFNQIFKNKDEIILRDYLALERTRLANERTLLAYSRTSLYMLLGGIAFLEMNDFIQIRWIGATAILLSIILMILGVYRYFQIKYRLSDYYKKSTHDNETKNEQ